jgi:hypothetical protein
MPDALSSRAASIRPVVHRKRDGLARQVIDANTRITFDSSAERQALVLRIMGARGGK